MLCICCIFSDCTECKKMTGSGGGYERWELHYSHMLPPSPPTSTSCAGERGGNNNNIKFLFPQNLSVISNKSVGCFCWLSVRTFCPLFANICLEGRVACVESGGVREGGNR